MVTIGYPFKSTGRLERRKNLAFEADTKDVFTIVLSKHFKRPNSPRTDLSYYNLANKYREGIPVCHQTLYRLNHVNRQYYLV